MTDKQLLLPALQEGGRRLGGVEKKSRPGKPLVTIITATFNASEGLPDTIRSIREQTYENIEWIVIDGQSTDASVELIRQNEDRIDYWLSEADKGIYDAWNKGLSQARGDWIAFLGAGDSYCPDAISRYMNAIAQSSVFPEFVSSRVRLVNSDGAELRIWGTHFDWGAFRKYMSVAHVGALHHRCLFEKYGDFDITYASAADYEFLMRCGATLKTKFLDVVTVDMLVGGVSNSYQGVHETYLIQERYGAGISAKFRYILACLKCFVRPLLRGY